MRVLHDGPLFLSYGQFSILEPMAEHPDLEDAFAGQRNGLCGGAVPGALHFMTGTHTGQIALRVEEYDEAPPLPEPEWGGCGRVRVQHDVQRTRADGADGR